MVQIDGVNFDIDELGVGFCGCQVINDLLELKNITKRIEYCHDIIQECNTDIDFFNQRIKNPTTRNKDEIETWICEREDKITIASYYINNILK